MASNQVRLLPFPWPIVLFAVIVHSPNQLSSRAILA